jgi:release factor glutamine methyltransferase
MASWTPSPATQNTFRELTQGVRTTLDSVTADPYLEAQLLLSFSIEEPRSTVLAWPERQASPAEASRFHGLIARRARGEPLAYLLGQREFWSLPLKVSPDTLIPRPDTECLVERALAVLPADARGSVVDLGTGSGAIALALAAERPELSIVAVDQCPRALAVARENAFRLGLGVQFLESDWFTELAGQRFSMIVANPPYVATNDPHLHQGDIRFEPRAALDGGPDGLSALRVIIATAAAHLIDQGALLLEHGFDQGEAVLELLHASGFQNCLDHTDLGQRPRVAEARWPGPVANPPSTRGHTGS